MKRVAQKENLLLSGGDRTQSGFAALLAMVIVLSTALVVIGSVNLMTVTEQKIIKNSFRSAQAYYTAETGVEDSVYRLIKGKNYLASNSLDVTSGSAAINISGSGSQKTITVSGQQDNRFRNLKAVLNVSTEEVSFYYGVQVGEGGLTMSNNSQVQGSIYSNGPIQGANGATLTGNVWVASIPADVNQQSTVVNADFIFGQSGNPIDAAQSFTPSTSDKIIKISLYLKKAGSPTDKTVRLLTDNGNKPSKTLVGSGSYGTLISSQISQSNYGWVDVTLNTPTNLQSGVKYWIVVDTSADANNYFFWGKDSTDVYSGGTGQYSPNWNASSPVWTADNGDLAFKAWLGETPNSLNSVAVGGSAHANTISSCAIAGDAYFQSISGSTVGGIQHPASPDPAMENMPISNANINDWKTQAEAGGIFNGNYNLTNGAVASLGPKKIVGNLTLSNNADLTLTGTVYVTGTINISNGGKLRLGTGYGDNSGVILTDGQISVSNNAVFYANGAGSYIMILSTKSGTAITIANNANTVIFYANQGAVDISNNAILKEVTAYQISLSNGAQIIYESGLASAKFSSGSGATWSIDEWRETP